VEKCTILCRTHIIPSLGASKLRDLSASNVDRWLETKAKTLSTSTLQVLHQVGEPGSGVRDVDREGP
jgi:hypothetical protein